MKTAIIFGMLAAWFVIMLVAGLGCPPPESVCPPNEHDEETIVGSGCVCDEGYVRALDGTCILDKLVF